MALTQAILGSRLRAAREAADLSQESVAESLGIPRTAVVGLEAGSRKVTSLELERLAKLYGTGLPALVSDHVAESPVRALFRAGPASAVGGPELKKHLFAVEELCREATRLERMLGRDQTKAPLVQYALAVPATRWEAIQQGRQLAELERNRLGLGIAPVWEIAEVIKRQGIRVVEADLADAVSGVFLWGRDVGSIIIVNQAEGDSRKLFSCAHEYCHALADRHRGVTVSEVKNREELPEIRANSFAAYFLMPEEGVRRYLDQIGKGPESRHVHQVFTVGGADLEDTTAQKRSVSSRRDLQLHDVIGLAFHFGVSFEAALYQILNLKLLDKSRFDDLRERKLEARGIREALRMPDREHKLDWLLTNQVLELGIEALRRGLISRRKLMHVAGELRVSPAAIGTILSAEGIEAEPVAPVIPK